MLRVVIIGYGDMFTNLIAGTLDANCKIVGVLRGDSVKYSPIIRKLKDIFNPTKEYNYIKSYNLPEIYTNSVNSEDFRKKLIKLNPDIILVGSWGEKFEKETYNIPKIATINAHPSLLPKYRGPNPYFWVIKNQEKNSGITFHLMDENFDTGAILAQEEIKLLQNETGKSLKERTVLVARGVVRELLKTLGEDVIIPLQQRVENASYFSHPDDIELDFRKKTAEENSAIVRAIFPWNNAYFYNDITPIIAEPREIEVLENNTHYSKAGTIVGIDVDKKSIKVLCSDNKILKIMINSYKKIDRPFFKNYIKQELKIGQILL